MDVQLTWTDCDEAGDYVVPNALSPRDLVSRPDNKDKTLLHTTHLCTERGSNPQWSGDCFHVSINGGLPF